jgi:vacuolar protein sorting-associated protein 35
VQARDKLPDTGSEYEAEGGGSVDDSIDFIITNFAETNRLWVRMQSQVRE